MEPVRGYNCFKYKKDYKRLAINQLTVHISNNWQHCNELFHFNSIIRVMYFTINHKIKKKKTKKIDEIFFAGSLTLACTNNTIEMMFINKSCIK